MTTAIADTALALPAARTSLQALMLTGTAPGEPGVGGVILKDLIDHDGVDHWHCCWLATKRGPQVPYWKELPTTVHKRQYEIGYRPVRGIVGEAISAVTQRVVRAPMIASMTGTLQRLYRETQPGFVLAVLDSTAVIETALRFQKQQPVPMRCIVWDDVDLLIRQNQLDRWTRSRIEKTFGEVLKRSERVAVICENMQSEYRRRYGIDSFVLRHGVSPLQTPFAPTDANAEDVFRIGFAGSVTAPDCLSALTAALDEVGWKIDGREIVLRLLGARYLLNSRRPQRIEYFGWRSVEETCARLSECDLLYMPQSFKDENRIFSELSFPTKLSTYIAVRRPILLHAPAYASLAGFWHQHPLGPWCAQCDHRDVLTTVTEAVRANEFERRKWGTEIVRAQEESLGLRQFAAGVMRLVSSANGTGTTAVTTDYCVRTARNENGQDACLRRTFSPRSRRRYRPSLADCAGSHFRSWRRCRSIHALAAQSAAATGT